MTTTTIASAADTKGLSQPDMDLQVLLRRKVIPGFLADVGYAAWRKKYAGVAMLVNDRYVTIPNNNFWHLKTVAFSGAENCPLTYIGDDETKVMIAEATTSADANTPTGFYLILHTDGAWRIYFNVPTSAATTALICYDTLIYFADDSTQVDLEPFIPVQFHWVLVEGLKREIFYDRFGVGDDRWQAADMEYKMWVERAKESPDLSRGSRLRYVD